MYDEPRQIFRWQGLPLCFGAPGNVYDQTEKIIAIIGIFIQTEKIKLGYANFPKSGFMKCPCMLMQKVIYSRFFQNTLDLCGLRFLSSGIFRFLCIGVEPGVYGWHLSADVLAPIVEFLA